MKRSCLNEIFVLPGSYSGYTIFSCQDGRVLVLPLETSSVLPRENLPERSSSALLTPVRDRLRKHFNSGSADNDSFSLDKFEDHITSLELSFPWNWLRLMSEVI